MIYFKREEELMYFCEVMFTSKREIDVKWQKNNKMGNKLSIKGTSLEKQEMLRYLVLVFLCYRMRHIICEIIEKMYYYSNEEEIDQIYLHTMEVIQTPLYADALFGEAVSLRAYIAALFEAQIQVNKQVYFDSLVTFCTSPLKKCLIDAVAHAIDEHKREEEYQAFLESVRTFIERRGVRSKTLHIVQSESLMFYKANGTLYSPIELKHIMQNTPLYIVGLDENEMNLSPVVSLSPERIYIYGNDPTEPKIVSLFNLFQEKVQFVARQYFPFERREID